MATLSADLNEFNTVFMAEGAAPSTPGSGLIVAYAKPGGVFAWKDDGGTEHVIPGNLAAEIVFDPTGLAHTTAVDVQDAIADLDAAITGGGGSVATDTIWNAAGDLAVGTGSDTAARLGIGNAGAVLARINGAVAWNAGTAFPTATTGDRFFRTDLGMEFYYDGTRWLSTQVFTLQPPPKIPGTTTTSVGDHQAQISATTSSAFRFLRPSVLGASNIWWVDYKVAFSVGSGTALSASHKWVATVVGADSSGASTGTAATLTIDSGANSTFREQTQAIGAAAAANTVFYLITWTKTGTPGALQTGEELTYRIIAT